MAVCQFHSRWRETALSCGRCGKGICVDCAIHTQVGLRCRECERNLSTSVGASKHTESQFYLTRPFVVGALGAVFVAMAMGVAAPVIALLELAGVAAALAHYQISSKRAFVIGLIYTGGYLCFVIIPVLVAAIPKDIALRHVHLSQLHSTRACVLVCLIGAVGVIYYLLLPAEAVVAQLREEKRDLLAGITIGALGAFIISVLYLLFVLVFAAS